MNAARDPPNAKGCVHTRITVECSTQECEHIAVLTFHQVKGANAPVAMVLPDGWRMVPLGGSDYAPSCPIHAENALQVMLMAAMLGEV